MQSFKCDNCGFEVQMEAIGTKHRNHCPNCLWSKHLDEKVPGDRSSRCMGMMKPVGLTFKNVPKGKGELMLAHRCIVCGVVLKNRVAGDDKESVIMKLFEDSLNLNEEEYAGIKNVGIELATKADERELLTQLFGKPVAEQKLGKL